MALPKLNNTPKYELTVPSSGEVIRHRPFLVKEEKVLMMAAETGEQKDTINALVDTIKACVESDFDVNKLTTFDVEYIFLQLRSKSIGETTKINLKCKECGTENPVSVNLNEIKIDMPKIEKHIKLQDDIAVDLDYPTFNDILQFGTEITGTEMAFKLLTKCIIAIHSGEERIVVKYVQESELIEFMESMNTEQFTKLRSFIDEMPKLQHNVSFCCKNCASANDMLVEGLDSFLS